MNQIAPIVAPKLVQILASQQIAGVDTEVDLGGTFDMLFLPSVFVNSQGAVVQNNSDVVLGIRINDPGAPVIPFAGTGDYFTWYAGPVTKIYVSLLPGAGAQLMGFYVGTRVGLGNGPSFPRVDLGLWSN